MAPFAPFLSEHLYQELATLSGVAAPKPASVHLCDYPEPEEHYTQPRLEEAVGVMQAVVLLGRRRREEARVNLRTPLRRLTIIHRDAALLEELRDLEDYLKRELNVKEVEYTQDEEKYIRWYARPNFPLLGKRLGKRMKAFQARIQLLERDQIERLQHQGRIAIDGEEFNTDEIQVLREAQPGTSTLSDSYISIDMDATVDEELRDEGSAREFLRGVQQERKDMNLAVTDRIHVTHDGDARQQAIIQQHWQSISTATLSLSIKTGDPGSSATQLMIDGKPLRIRIERAT
jgi:isoleucyl-tRNA synthetase